LIKKSLKILLLGLLVGCGPGLQDGSTKVTGDIYLFSRHVLGDSLLLKISKGHSQTLVEEHVIAYKLVGSRLGVAQYPVDFRNPDYEIIHDCVFYLININNNNKQGPLTHSEFYLDVDRQNLGINLFANTGKYSHLCKKISR